MRQRGQIRRAAELAVPDHLINAQVFDTIRAVGIWLGIWREHKNLSKMMHTSEGSLPSIQAISRSEKRINRSTGRAPPNDDASGKSGVWAKGLSTKALTFRYADSVVIL
jgi:hypothetical protein